MLTVPVVEIPGMADHVAGESLLGRRLRVRTPECRRTIDDLEHGDGGVWQAVPIHGVAGQRRRGLVLRDAFAKSPQLEERAADPRQHERARRGIPWRHSAEGKLIEADRCLEIAARELLSLRVEYRSRDGRKGREDVAWLREHAGVQPGGDDTAVGAENERHLEPVVLRFQRRQLRLRRRRGQRGFEARELERQTIPHENGRRGVVGPKAVFPFGQCTESEITERQAWRDDQGDHGQQRDTTGHSHSGTHGQEDTAAETGEL